MYDFSALCFTSTSDAYPFNMGEMTARLYASALLCFSPLELEIVVKLPGKER
jgi:hypothetical protein